MPSELLSRGQTAAPFRTWISIERRVSTAS